jgi:hypothetical protein
MKSRQRKRFNTIKVATEVTPKKEANEDLREEQASPRIKSAKPVV